MFLKFQVKPPLYDITKITTPFAMFYGTNDAIATVEDVKSVAKTLKNLIGLYEIGNNWTHLDFVWGMDSGKLLFNKMIDILNESDRVH